MNKKTIAVIGVGNIGLNLISLLIQAMQTKSITQIGKIIGIDKNRERLEAQFSDQLHALLLNELELEPYKRIFVNEITKHLVFTSDFNFLTDADYLVTSFSVPMSPNIKTRSDLLFANIKIARQVAEKIKLFCKKTVTVLNLSNPLDVLTWDLQELLGYDRALVLGVSGLLDKMRLMQAIHEVTGESFQAIQLGDASIGGEHGDMMVPLLSNVTINNQPLVDQINSQQAKLIKQFAIYQGTKMMIQLGNRPAHIGPSQAALHLLKAFLNNNSRVISCCAWNQEFKSYMTSPVRINQAEVEVLPIQCNASEKQELLAAADHIRKVKKLLENDNI